MVASIGYGIFGLLLIAEISTSSVIIPINKLYTRTPPDIPSTSIANSELEDLTVATRGSSDGYSRSKFKHWITISGSCNTREEVLKRDGENVVTGSNCAAESGSWYSPYDGETWTAASDVDIDHVVPLSLAWKSGASDWTTDTRQDFANDLDHPQLIAVTDNVNSAKGDSGPEEWKPPLESYWCTYAKMFIRVKYTYNLTVTSDERSALEDMMEMC
ncbi:MAG: hypothetical protein M1834_007084 [Cirrosporium novae-zelandiae]|nr:MAG: hypothetical protein M1834_007084 [Cirrosporium novae-zelandiae]